MATGLKRGARRWCRGWHCRCCGTRAAGLHQLLQQCRVHELLVQRGGLLKRQSSHLTARQHQQTRCPRGGALIHSCYGGGLWAGWSRGYHLTSRPLRTARSSLLLLLLQSVMLPSHRGGGHEQAGVVLRLSGCVGLELLLLLLQLLLLLP